MKEGAEAEIEKKGIFQKWMRHRAYKLDNLQPVKPISSQYVYTFLPFILGGPISYYPRERKEGRSRCWKWEKENPPKVNETQWFLDLGHTNWTICSLLSRFCPKKIPTFCLSYWEVQYLITPRERKEGRSRGGKWEKGNPPKVNETQGFLDLGHTNWTIYSLLSQFGQKHLHLFAFYTGRSNFLLPQRERMKEGAGAENEKKGILQKWIRHRGLLIWGIQTGPFVAC